MESELWDEVTPEDQEVDWLHDTGSKLAQACTGDGETEVEHRMETEGKVQLVDHISHLIKSRVNKLHYILKVNILVDLLLLPQKKVKKFKIM